MNAETAYLFRHALVRDAAYELQPPGERAALHAAALHCIELLYGGEAPIESELWSPRPPEHATDPFLPALVEHAAAAPDTPEIRHKGALYLYRAANSEIAGYRFPSALLLLERLATHPGATDYLRARAHFLAGELHYRLGDLERSRREYDNCARYVDLDADPVAAVILRSCNTVVDSHTDNGPQVAAVHKQAADFWRARGDIRKLLGSLINFGVWHCEEGSESIARETMQEVLALGREHGLLLALSSGYGLIALLDAKLDRPDAAEAGLREAIRYAQEAGDPIRETSWLNNLADLYREASRFDEAETCLRQTEELCERYGLEARGNFALGTRAGVLVQRGRVGDARDLWNQAWRNSTERNDPYELKVLRWMMNDSLERAGLEPLPEDGFLP